jgi:hypothetical protein
VPPSPKAQSQLTGEFNEVSLNWTYRGTVPEVVFDVKDAMGVARVVVM